MLTVVKPLQVTNEPTAASREQLAAAILAYDEALPPGVQRPQLIVHAGAIEAAVSAALKVAR